MKHFCLLAISLFMMSAATAQVEIIADPSVEEMENARIAKRKSLGSNVHGYRIMVGFYSKRDEATSKLSEARSIFGDQYPSTMLYDEPNFKVYVGEFVSKADADAALVYIRKRYAGARIVNDLVPAPRVH
ncbi:MAG: SPOR domain-containing protein [Bacteroidetes bacterium]|nr:SPOR domain-containing protein [Bacteroidota bacterium]